MLSIVTGPFHPDLENALVAEVHSLKREDPLRPLAVVVPSRQLARRVKWLLAVEQGRALLECHVLTFHQLAMTVLREAGGEALPSLVNGFFREELLRYLVDRGVPGAEAFRDRRGMQGLWTGLWATVQDLKEARVDRPPCYRRWTRGGSGPKTRRAWPRWCACTRPFSKWTGRCGSPTRTIWPPWPWNAWRTLRS